MNVDTLYFVDTNILVYGQDSQFPKKRQIALEWLDYLWINQVGRISIQVLNEYWVTVTQKLKPGLSQNEAWEDLEALMTWRPLPMNEALLFQARISYQESDFSWWDALIVGAATLSKCSYLLTEDLGHKQSLHGVEILNPFKTPVPQ